MPRAAGKIDSVSAFRAAPRRARQHGLHRKEAVMGRRPLNTLAGALAFALVVPAAQAQVPGEHFILNWDLDRDGAVTLDEAREKRGEVFYMFDQNEDGALDSAEYDLFDETRAADMAANEARGAMRPVEAGLRREANDADGDGVVTEAEFVGMAEDWLAGIDADGDGLITRADFAGRRPGAGGQGQSGSQGQGQGQGGGQTGQGGGQGRPGG
jgi:hypothetical protein